MFSVGRHFALPISLVVVGAVYVLTLPRLITFEDAGLFQQVCYFGGIAHPPGYPLFTVLCAPLYQAGLDPVWTGNLISSFFALLTLAVLFALLRRLDVSVPVACTACLLFGLSLDFWSQAIIIEVYTLNTFLVASLLWLAIRFVQLRERWIFPAMAFTLGLSLSNHWPLTVAAAPGLLLILMSCWRASFAVLFRVGVLARVVPGFLLGLSPYLWMLTRPENVFGYSGQIEGLREFIHYVARDSYADVDSTGYATVQDRLHFIGWFLLRLVEQSGWLFVALGLFGAWTGFRQRPLLNSGILLVFLGNSFLLIALLGFEYAFAYQTAFSHYPLVAFLCWFTWVGTGMQALVEIVKGQSVPVRAAVLVALVVAVLAAVLVNFSRNDRHADALARDYAMALLESLPPDAVLVVDADAQIGPIGFLQSVAGVRPDITVFEGDNTFTRNTLPQDPATRRDFLLRLAEHRPVFGVYIPWLPVVRHHGFYQAIGEGEAVTYAAEPAHLPLIAAIAQRYVTGGFPVDVNAGFAHQTLIGAGHHLFVRASAAGHLPEEVETLALVQQTFPGALGVVSTAMVTGQGGLSRDEMLALLAPHEGNFPRAATPANIAEYYTMLAALHDRPAADRYLTQAWRAMPDERNPVYCSFNPCAE